MCWAPVGWKCSIFTQHFFKFTYQSLLSLALLFFHIKLCLYYSTSSALVIFLRSKGGKTGFNFKFDCLFCFFLPLQKRFKFESFWTRQWIIYKIKARQNHRRFFWSYWSLKSDATSYSQHPLLSAAFENESYLALADMDTRELKTCFRRMFTHMQLHLLVPDIETENKVVAVLRTVWGLAVGEAPLRAPDVHVSHHMCRSGGRSPVSLCRLEIKPLVRPGHPLIVAAVERYKIRAQRGFLLPGVSDLEKKRKKKGDGRMMGSVRMDVQWTNVSLRLVKVVPRILFVTVTVAFVQCR